MKKKVLIFIIILTIGISQLNAQIEFIDQASLGVNLNFPLEDDIKFNFAIDYSFGLHLHKTNTSLLAGIRINMVDNFNLGGQINYYFNHENGLGITLSGGVHMPNFNFEEIVPYARAGIFFHFLKQYKASLEFEYRLGKSFSAGLMISVPAATFSSRMNTYKRVNSVPFTIINNTGYTLKSASLVPQDTVNPQISDFTLLDFGGNLETGNSRIVRVSPFFDLNTKYELVLYDTGDDNYNLFNIFITPGMNINVTLSDASMYKQIIHYLDN